MAHRTDFPFPQRVIPIDRSGIDAFVPAPDDDIEEFPLLLKLSEVQELIQAARQEGLTAAGLARSLIRDYLSWVRHDSGKGPSRRLRLLQPGDER